MSSTITLEMAPFRLAAGTIETSLFEASARLEQEFLSKQAGYIGRALTRLPDGSWADIVMWQSKAAAEAIIPLVSHSDAAGAYFACMEAADMNNPAHGITLMQAQRLYGALAELPPSASGR